MNLLYLKTLLLILFSVFLYGKDSDSINIRTFFYVLKYQPNINENHKNETEFVLSVNTKNKKSIFTDLVNRDAESMETQIRERYEKIGGTYSFRGVPKPKFYYYITKNLVENNIEFYDKIGVKHFSYDEITEFDWKIVNETKSYEGILCQKAITEKFGRKWIAWFAPEIPINDGPYKFCNLPGLIVEIYDEKEHYYFQLIKYSKNDNNYKVEIPDYIKRKTIKTDKKSFVEGKSNYENSKIERLKNSFLGNTLTENDYRRIREEMKKNNNPLEL